MNRDILTILEEKETFIRDKVKEENHEELYYYRALIDAFDICLNNAKELISSDKKELDIKIFTYIIIPRYISVSKSSIDLALSGHPFEAFSLSRILLEMSQVSQYMLFYPEDIGRYIAGKLKIDDIRKRLSRTYKNKAGDKLFGLLSTFSHSTRENLFTPLFENENGLNSSILSENYELIKNVIIGVIHNTWSQYIFIRKVFSDLPIKNDRLIELDAIIMDYTRFKSIFISNSDGSLEEISEFIRNLN